MGGKVGRLCHVASTHLRTPAALSDVGTEPLDVASYELQLPVSRSVMESSALMPRTPSNDLWKTISTRWCGSLLVALFCLQAPAWSTDRLTPEVKAVQKTRPTVVNIRGKKTVRDQSRQYEAEPNRQVNGMGTGVLIDPRGYVITNFHVVEGVSNIQVTLPDQRTFDADLVARDAKTDIALIKIAARDEFPTIEIGDSSDLMLAERVIAIGNAYGYENSVSVGVISELHRTVQVSDDQVYYDLIQTDAAINPGNSGGPLLNIHGEMIGLNVAVRVGAQGIAFAIPVNQAMDVVAGLIARRTNAEAVHGVTGHTDRHSAGTRFVVDRVVPGSPADLAGVVAGDIISRIDAISVASRFDFERSFLDRDSGQELDLALTRGTEDLDTSLVLKAVSPSTRVGDPAWSVLGVKLSNIDSEDLRRLTSRYNGGMRVLEVRDGSPADRRGIKSGDVLVGIHIWETTSFKDMRYILSRPEVTDADQGVSFFILRGREEFFGNIRISANEEPDAATRTE